MLNMFASPSSSTILECSKSLKSKVRSPIRVFIKTKAHNFAWEEDLKKKDEDSLTIGDV